MAQERPRVPADVVWGVLDDALVHVVRILAAVSCCMLLVVVTVRINPQFLDSQGATLPYTPLPDTEEQTTVARASHAAGNALILIGAVIFMTTLMVSLYYYHFYKVIAVWVTCACVLILLMTSNTYISLIFRTYNVPADYFSVGFFVYNFTALGLVVILSKGPLILQQVYLVIESAFMALMLITFLPPYTVWVVLAIIPIWDLVAVLAVHGPLRILVETAKERKEGLQPGLVFATVVVGTFPGMASRPRGYSAAGRPSGVRGRSPESRLVGRRSPDVTPEGQDTSNRRTTNVKPIGPADSRRRPLHATDTAPKPDDDTIRPGPRVFSPPKKAAKVRTEADLPVSPTQAKNPPPKRDDSDSSSDGGQERQGIKMGLGDFVFYSVLVGKVATFGDWTIVCACFVGILVGICVTLFVLAITQSALPALPVSLAFGLLFAGFQQSVQNFMNEVSLKHAFI